MKFADIAKKTDQELAELLLSSRAEMAKAIIDSRTLRKNPSRIDREVLTDPPAWPHQWSALATLFPDHDPVYLVRLR